MIIKNNLVMEILKDDRRYALSFPSGVPVAELYASIHMMLEHVGKIISEQGEEALEKEEVTTRQGHVKEQEKDSQ